MGNDSMSEDFQLNIPKELLSEAHRQSQANRDQLHVEGWRTSWLTRLSEMFVGKD